MSKYAKMFYSLLHVESKWLIRYMENACTSDITDLTFDAILAMGED